jgi:cell division protein FtsB
MKVFITNIVSFVKTNRKLLIRVGICIGVIYFLLFTDYGIMKTIDLLVEKNEITQKIEDANYVRDSLKKRIIQLSMDSLEIERIAREHYGLVKPGEYIYISSEK